MSALKTICALVLLIAVLVCYSAVVDAASATPSTTPTANIPAGSRLVIPIKCGNSVKRCNKIQQLTNVCVRQLRGTVSAVGLRPGTTNKYQVNCTWTYFTGGSFRFRTAKFSCAQSRRRKMQRLCRKIPKSTLTATVVNATACSYTCTWR